MKGRTTMMRARHYFFVMIDRAFDLANRRPLALHAATGAASEARPARDAHAYRPVDQRISIWQSTISNRQSEIHGASDFHLLIAPRVGC